MSLADLINLAIAVFTAAAAIAAWVSTTASLKATEKANETAEESRKIAHEQTQALMLAAKANALASRISFYSEQIRTLEKQLQDYQQRGWAPEPMAGVFCFLPRYHVAKILDYFFGL